MPLPLFFYLFEDSSHSTTAHDGSKTEEGALYPSSDDELQQPGATGSAVVPHPAIIKELSNYYAGKIAQVLWVVIHRHQQRILEVNSPVSNAVPGKRK